ncbi:MAG: hypothetical protein ABIO36_06640 [Pyrinomonadaceae bacterium]
MSDSLFESQSKRNINFKAGAIGLIRVAIPQGNFTPENKLDFEWGGKQWLIAETTVRGFQIGRSHVTDSIRLGIVNCAQDPRNSDVIFDASSFAVLKFL